jgi:ribosomal-protein-alanine N-acetyltransferase
VTVELVSGDRTHREFVRALCAEAFSRFGDYDIILPPLIGQPSIRTVIARDRTRPVGFAIFSLEELADGEVDLLAIAVTAAWQRRGVGRRLLEHVEKQARERVTVHPRWLILAVAEDNRRARHLFERAGFTVVAGEPGTYPRGQRSIRMRKRLA